MRIEELSPNLNITLFVNISDQQLTFESKILEVYPKKRIVLAQAIYRNDRIVTFKGANVSVDVLVTIGEEKPQLFKKVEVTLVKKGDGSLCYNLATSNESKPVNRRQSFRCYVGRNSTMQYGPTHASVEVIIRDVSITGFSVVCDEELPLEKNQVVHVVLTDYLGSENEKYSFHLYGLVARTQEMGRNRVLYGCRLNNPVPGLEAYIMKKERLRLRESSGLN